MRRHWVKSVVVVAAVVWISAWLFASEHRGPFPERHDPATEPETQLLVQPDADAQRLDLLRRAAVRLDPAAIPASAVLDELQRREVPICRFLKEAPSGTSAKFDCIVPGGEVVKVKYGRNPETHAEVAASRLLAALGFPTDRVALLPKLRCYGCPRFPFLAMRVLFALGMDDLLAPHGYDSGYSDFEWVSVEHKFPAVAIETPRRAGWAWFELDSLTGPPADVDALRLMAVFLAHWDNKSENQRLVCADSEASEHPVPCARPLAMVQDLGATFGPNKVNLSRWRALPLWADRRTCTVSMRTLPWSGGTFVDVRISEPGRALLARELSMLSDDWIRRLFAEARFPAYHIATDDDRDLDEWVAAFRHKVDQLVTAGPCPPKSEAARSSG